MHVLVGVGGRHNSVAALERAVDRAIATGDDLTVALFETDHAERDEIRSRTDEILAAAPIDATVRHLDGDPGSSLVDIAESEGFDEIVIGGGTTSPMGKIKIDATTEFVLLNSHTTVTLVR